MKKLIVVLGITLSLLYSCTNDEIKSNDINEARIASVLSEKNTDAQKSMYRMLSKEDKQALWINKLDSLITDKNLNETQTKLLTGLRSQLTVSIFDDNSNNDQREVFKNVYIPYFIKEAQEIFSKDYIYNNFYEIQNYPKTLAMSTSNNGLNNRSGDIGIGGETACTCNVGSMVSCGSGISCRQPLWEGCTSTTSGCGAFWVYSCNGMCIL